MANQFNYMKLYKNLYGTTRMPITFPICMDKLLAGEFNNIHLNDTEKMAINYYADILDNNNSEHSSYHKKIRIRQVFERTRIKLWKNVDVKFFLTKGLIVDYIDYNISDDSINELFDNIDYDKLYCKIFDESQSIFTGMRYHASSKFKYHLKWGIKNKILLPLYSNISSDDITVIISRYLHGESYTQIAKTSSAKYPSAVKRIIEKFYAICKDNYDLLKFGIKSFKPAITDEKILFNQLMVTHNIPLEAYLQLISIGIDTIDKFNLADETILDYIIADNDEIREAFSDIKNTIKQNGR